MSKIELNGKTIILENFMDISKVVEGANTSKVESINLKELLYKLYSKFSPILATKNLEFIYTPNLTDINIDVDIIKLNFIISSLLDNAIANTGQGSIKFEANLIKTATCLLVSITDTGRGLSEKQTQAVQTGNNIGSALGKAVYYINDMQGSLFIDSTLGEGSSFHISLPISKTKGSVDMLKAVSNIRVLILSDTKYITNLELLIPSVLSYISIVSEFDDAKFKIKNMYYDVILVREEYRHNLVEFMEANFYNTPCITLPREDLVDLKQLIDTFSEYQSINAFNSEKVLSSYGSKLQLYYKMTDAFELSFTYHISKIAKLLDKGYLTAEDLEILCISFHTLKGSSSSLFIEGIRHIAHNIEVRLKTERLNRKSDRNSIQESVDILKTNYCKTLQRLETFKESNSA